MKSRGLLILCFFLILAIPVSSMGYPFYEYTAIGSADDVTGKTYVITGEVVIDPQLRDWVTMEPYDVNLRREYYGYFIPYFSLYVGGLSFNGSPYGSSYLYMEPGAWHEGTGDRQFCFTGQGAWYQWDGWAAFFMFYNQDGTPYGPTMEEHSHLAPVIQLVGGGSWPQFYTDPGQTDPQFPFWESNKHFSLWLVQTSPVPEPSTLLLLGSGLVGLAGYGRKKFFKK